MRALYENQGIFMRGVVRILEANHGDCILVSHEGASGIINILIDGGEHQQLLNMGRGCVMTERYEKY